VFVESSRTHEYVSVEHNLKKKSEIRAGEIYVGYLKLLGIVE